MKIGIMQPYFFPYLGYWQLINTVDKYIIYDDVNYIKGGWINRNRILIQDEAKFINLKIQNASPNRQINEIETLEDPVYNNKLIKTLEMNYHKAPFFSDVFPAIENIIKYNEKNLAKYLEYQITSICRYLSIHTEIMVSTAIKKNGLLKGQDKVIEICKIVGASEYINAIGGMDLYSNSAFIAQGIQLKFLKMNDIRYKQFKNEFIPNLSIIDVMMFNSIHQIKTYLAEYTLI
jgi:WbqC-like protein family.